MSEIRQAKPDDFEQVMTLWLEYLTEVQKHGGEIVPSKRTMDFYGGLIAAYINGDMIGEVLLTADDNALVVWGELGELPWDTTFGKLAHGHGVYVRPEFRGHGHSMRLRRSAADRLRNRGIETVISGVHMDNKESFKSYWRVGFKPHQKLGILNLGSD